MKYIYHALGILAAIIIVTTTVDQYNESHHKPELIERS